VDRVAQDAWGHASSAQAPPKRGEP
jgi:hypothetical protein